MKWLWIGVLVLLAIAGASIFVAFQRPDFVGGLVTYGVSIAGAAIVGKIFKPAPFTEEQLQAIREGRNPFRKRPREH